MKITNLEEKAEQAVIGCLKQVPLLKIKRQKKTPEGIDYFFALDSSSFDDKRQLLVIVKSNGQPRFARDAINQLHRYREKYSNMYGIFVAPYISESTSDMCSAEGVGYIDLAGNCRLSFDGVYIQKDGQPNTFSEKRDLRSLYSPRAERVLRVLLNHPDKSWKTQELSGEAKVSIGQAYNVKKTLLAREWAYAGKKGVSLTQPAKLLKDWASNYFLHRTVFYSFYSLQKPAEIEANLLQVCQEEMIQYAFTGFSGAIRIAPFVQYQRVQAYIADNLDIVVERMQLKPVSSGANVYLTEPYDREIFYGTRVIDDTAVVSPIQLYLDLKHTGARGEEAAEAIFEKVIEPQW